MALNVVTDIRRAFKEVPPWGWGVIGMGTLYLVLHRARSSAASSSAAAAAPVVAAQDPLSTSDPSGGMSAYISSLNGGYADQAAILSAALTNLEAQNQQNLSQVGAGPTSGGSSSSGPVATDPGGSDPFIPPGSYPAVPSTPPGPVPGSFQNTQHPIYGGPADPGSVMGPEAPPAPVVGSGYSGVGGALQPMVPRDIAPPSLPLPPPPPAIPAQVPESPDPVLRNLDPLGHGHIGPPPLWGNLDHIPAPVLSDVGVH